MAALGRPTPQPVPNADERPRFRDRLPDEFERPEVNPYLAMHRAYDACLLPASEAWRHRDDWATAFGRSAPLHLEIGSGNGFFLSGLAAAHPDWNVLGVEIRYKRVVLCAKKIVDRGITNAKIARYHAAYLDDLVPPQSLEGIYVNHPDPWPRHREEKNRLISRWFLEDCVRLLRPGGRLRIKSDFPPNVERVGELLSDTHLPPLPLTIVGRSNHVVRDGAPWPDDIETNYQRKKRIEGVPVLALDVLRGPDQPT